jgi:hypothetical protein
MAVNAVRGIALSSISAIRGIAKASIAAIGGQSVAGGGGGGSVTLTERVNATSTDGHGAGAYTPGAFTPGNGKRLLALCWAMGNSNDALEGTDLTITDSMGPLTWTSITNSTTSPAWGHGVRAWISSATTSSTSMTVSVDAGTFAIRNYHVVVYELTGEHASPLGATIAGSDADGTGALALTLSAAPASSSTVFAMLLVAHDSTVGSVDHGTGMTEVLDVPKNGWCNFQLQTRTGSTSDQVPWAELNNGGSTPLGASAIAFELKAA